MAHRILTTLVAAGLLMGGMGPSPARADNAMGYRLLSAQEAASLPRNNGALGMDVERSQQITDSGMTFEIIRVKQVRRGSPGAQAGFRPGDQIIAVNGRVFPSIAAFAAYVGAISPGSQATIDYIPAGGGPAQAQRVPVTIGGPGRSAQPSGNPNEAAPSTGMSTGSKIAIGVGAAALLGCYEMGCFSHRGSTSAPRAQPPLQQPGQYQR
ncbi:MAG TPA: PDZ domain-containing protein [Acetobacteraceae bacterium]